jgi:hypothetical protein
VEVFLQNIFGHGWHGLHFRWFEPVDAAIIEKIVAIPDEAASLAALALLIGIFDDVTLRVVIAEHIGVRDVDVRRPSAQQIGMNSAVVTTRHEIPNDGKDNHSGYQEKEEE